VQSANPGDKADGAAFERRLSPEDNGALRCSHGRVIIIDSITALVILPAKLPRSPYRIAIVTAGSRLISAYDDITRAQRATRNYCKPRPLNIPSAVANRSR